MQFCGNPNILKYSF